MVAQVQNAGRARITAALIALNWWLHWGTGSGAAVTANNVTLTGVVEARQPAVASQQTTTVTNDTLQLTATITEASAGPIAITEVGAFDALTAGNMDVYADFSAINVSSGDSIAFTVKVKFS